MADVAPALTAHDPDMTSATAIGERARVLRGECLCGSVTFELVASHQYGPDRAMGFCHCLRCQRWSGGTGLPFVVAVPERFRVTRGQEYLAHYRDDTAALRTFCHMCGSSLYEDDGTTYHVGAGALHDLGQLAPSFHLHAACKPAWDQGTS